MSALADDIELEAELDRVGVSMRTAGNAAGVSAARRGEHVDIYGPEREQPPRHWRGTEHAALELLSLLPDDAGVSAFWKTFTSWHPGEFVFLPRS